MQKIQDMNDFELYIHALAQGECAEEDVCVLSEPAGAYFSNEQQDDSLAWLIRQLFDGLDTWSREGSLNGWNGTPYMRSVLAFIGSPAEHGKLIVDGQEESAEDGW